MCVHVPQEDVALIGVSRACECCLCHILSRQQCHEHAVPLVLSRGIRVQPWEKVCRISAVCCPQIPCWVRASVGNIPIMGVTLGSVGGDAPQVQRWSSVPALCFGIHKPSLLLGMEVMIGVTNIHQASCADISQAERLWLNYFNSNCLIHMHSMYFSYRVGSESVG